MKIKIHISIIVPALLYGFESWSVTMRDEFGLWVFEKRILKKRGRNDRNGGEYSSPNILWVIKLRI
jgi:hypothetical protein